MIENTGEDQITHVEEEITVRFVTADGTCFEWRPTRIGAKICETAFESADFYGADRKVSKGVYD